MKLPHLTTIKSTFKRRGGSIAISAILSTAIGCAGQQKPSMNAEDKTLRPEIWPQITSSVPKTDAIESRIAGILQDMTLEEKVGQIIQAEISHITPEQAQKFHIGSVLNGGGSFPKANKYSTAQDWVDLADAFYAASTDTSDGFQGIPIIWGSDAVHGHNNVLGATILPHNIGLGAANNPELIYKLGEITAKEVLATGLDWTFAPTLAVVRDDRWGRTYESYSENPEIVERYASEVVHGIQGKYSDGNFMDEHHLLANAKHYLGDGGTYEGRDQGDNHASEEELRDIHAPGYFAALEAGAQIVMSSFSSWKGDKLHGHKALLTDILKDQMGFDGFVISDWNGHQQVPGCSAGSCPAAINAGIDMIMVTEDWEAFFRNTLKQVKSGEISTERLNDAVTRILRVKARAGVLDAPAPSKRTYAGANILGAPEHRAVARQAVRESLVLLKNNQRTLPLSPKQHVLVLGDGADNIGKQSGGWTLSWQGTGNTNADFPNGESIYSGIKTIVEGSEGSIELSSSSKLSYEKKPDVAIIVFGEDPYAEFQGDRKTLRFDDPENTNLKLLQQLKSKGIPTVAIFLTGRPLWVNQYINLADAFVAAWLPGTEGGGIADVIFKGANEEIQHDFKGRLSFSWPKKANQFILNQGQDDYDPLFKMGYGLDYSSNKELGQLDEESGLAADVVESAGVFFVEGRTLPPWKFYLQSRSGSGVLVSGMEIKSRDGNLTAKLTDRNKQGDSQQFSWNGSAEADVVLTSHQVQDFSREANGGLSLALQLKVEDLEPGDVSLRFECTNSCTGVLPINSHLAKAKRNEWTTLRLPLNCFAQRGASMDKISRMIIRSSTKLALSISDARLVSASEGADPCEI